MWSKRQTLMGVSTLKSIFELVFCFKLDFESFFCHVWAVKKFFIILHSPVVFKAFSPLPLPSRGKLFCKLSNVTAIFLTRWTWNKFSLKCNNSIPIFPHCWTASLGRHRKVCEPVTRRPSYWVFLRLPREKKRSACAIQVLFFMYTFLLQSSRLYYRLQWWKGMAEAFWKEGEGHKSWMEILVGAGRFQSWAVPKYRGWKKLGCFEAKTFSSRFFLFLSYSLANRLSEWKFDFLVISMLSNNLSVWEKEQTYDLEYIIIVNWLTSSLLVIQYSEQFQWQLCNHFIYWISFLI